MAIQIFPREGSFGQTLGASLGGGLQAFGNEFSKAIELQRKAEGLQSLGFSPEEAVGLAAQDPQIVNSIINALGQRGALGKQTQPPMDQQGTQVAQGRDTEAPDISPQSQKSTTAQKLQQPTLTQVREEKKMDLAQKTLDLQERKFKSQQKKEKSQEKQRANEKAFKETKELRKELIDDERSARNRLETLDAMEELVQSGKLSSPGAEEFLKRSGLDIQALRNPETQAFQKLRVDFIKDAKNLFGARVTNFELEQFMKGVPSLSQSPEGMMRLISTLKKVERAKKSQGKLAREIIKENNGVPPLDLGEKIQDRMNKQLDKIAEKFKKDLKKRPPAEYAPSQAGTIAGVLGGELVGRAPGALAAGGLGALLGGPAGALAGTGIGLLAPEFANKIGSAFRGG